MNIYSLSKTLSLGLVSSIILGMSIGSVTAICTPTQLQNGDPTCDAYCGTLNGSTYTSTTTSPIGNYCEGDSFQRNMYFDNSNGNRIWTCKSLGGGNDITCHTIPITSPTPINGTCNNTTLNSCTAGSFVDRTDSATQYLWSCNGLNGGTNTATCAKDKPTPPPISPNADCPSCRPITCQDQFGTIVDDSLCNASTRPSSAGTTVAAGSVAWCPLVPVNGVCGSLNGQTTPSPTPVPTSAQLCTSGTPLLTSMTGPTRSRQCLGANGGTVSSCNTIEAPVCNPPYIIGYALNVTQDPSIKAGANGVFNISFNQNVYENARIRVTYPVGQTGTSTNYSPASVGVFGSTSRTMHLIATCKSNGQEVISNSIQGTGTNSTTNPPTTQTQVWIDGTPFNWGGIGYGYFRPNKTSVDPTTNLQDACGGYVVQPTGLPSTTLWYKYECVANNGLAPFGSFSTRYKYLMNEGSSPGAIYTNSAGVPLDAPNNMPTYSTIGTASNRLSVDSMITRFVPIAPAYQ